PLAVVDSKRSGWVGFARRQQTEGTAMSTARMRCGVRPRRWSKEEYYRLGELGFFDGQRVELIEGRLMVHSPQKPLHSAVVDAVLPFQPAAAVPECLWPSARRGYPSAAALADQGGQDQFCGPLDLLP